MRESTDPSTHHITVEDGGPVKESQMETKFPGNLRDYFAIHALTQASTALQCRIYIANINKNFNELAQLAVITDNMFRMAKDAYNMADVMIAEREKGSTND